MQIIMIINEFLLSIPQLYKDKFIIIIIIMFS